MRNAIWLFIVGLLLTALVPVPGMGQATASGTLQGTVTDNSQAVVVGAEAVAVNRGSGASRTATTDGSGELSLRIGDLRYSSRTLGLLRLRSGQALDSFVA
jgi:hypothetical protein